MTARNRGGRPSLPPQNVLDVIFAEQDGCCLYCGLEIGEFNLRKGQEVLLELVWDHILPWSYSRDRSVDNIAAACQVCNAIKFDHIYSSIEAAQQDISARRRQKGYRF